jgi:hypothetical protein
MKYWQNYKTKISPLDQNLIREDKNGWMIQN